VSEEEELELGPFERRRRAIVATVPAWYSPSVHLAIPTAIGLTIMAFSLIGLRDVRPTDWLTIPISLLGGFALEWRAHKSVLHQRQPGLSLLYERHELAHHVIYTDESMEMRDKRELWLILMPAYAIVMVFVGVIPLAWALRAFVNENTARLMVATSMLFFLSYEWLHMAYHQPKASFVGRNRLIGVLRSMHRRHHDPRLMKSWNFNVTVPVFDLVHGTIWSEEREKERARKVSRRRGPSRRSAP
jgi:Fatty acid hydroxylase superfamily